jgi:hypothetical protein
LLLINPSFPRFRWPQDELLLKLRSSPEECQVPGSSECDNHRKLTSTTPQ